MLAHCLGRPGPPDTYFLEILLTKYRLTVLNHIVINTGIFFKYPIFHVVM